MVHDVERELRQVKSFLLEYCIPLQKNPVHAQISLTFVLSKNDRRKEPTLPSKLRTGLVGQDQAIKDPSMEFLETVAALLRLFAKQSIRTSIYCAKGDGRHVVHEEDMKMSMKLTARSFFESRSDQDLYEEVRGELRAMEDEGEDEDEDERESGEADGEESEDEDERESGGETEKRARGQKWTERGILRR